MKRIRNLHGELKQGLPKYLNGVENLASYSTAELNAKGFEVYDYDEPTLADNHIKGELVIKSGKATHTKVNHNIDLNALANQKKEELHSFSKEVLSELNLLETTHTILGSTVPNVTISDNTITYTAYRQFLLNKLNEEKAEINAFVDG